MDLEPLDPGLFGDRSARDDRFHVVDRWVECVNLPDGVPEKVVEFLHRQMNEELNVLENAARNLVEFPEVEWDLRLALARQCADEARHAQAYRRMFERRGGRVGQYPVLNFPYRVLGRIPHLIGRLAVQNRTFEADGLDAAVFGAEQARRDGDHELAAMYEAQQADEVMHVRFANEWINAQVRTEPRNLLRLSSALTLAARAFAQVFAFGGANVTKYGVDVEARIDAGFSRDEALVAVERAEARRRLALSRQTP
jgi:uncharacterized ferritin-like protein (DUF455 family)